MSATLLPELAAESAETADRLVRLTAEERLDAAEAEYVLAAGVAATQRVPGLWPIVRGRIASGTTGPAAQQLLTRLLEALDRNLALTAALKELTRVIRAERGQEPEAATGLSAAEEHRVPDTIPWRT